MKIVTISDTHGKHKGLTLPEADMIIHAGDITSNGDELQVKSFLTWFSNLKIQHKIFVAGNHDFYFERKPEELIKAIIPENIIYLNDQLVSIDGLNIWGSPITPWFYDWAFNRERGQEIKKHWDLIPIISDIIVTHGPIHSVLDQTIHGQHAGCEDLANRVYDIKPKAHICGHIHESFGQVNLRGIKFINASVLNEHYKLVNEPIVFEL